VTGDRFILDEEKLAFKKLVADLKNDYQLPYQRGFFGFDRAIDLSPDPVRA
jgi:hypothetical protein